VDIILEACVCN